MARSRGRTVKLPHPLWDGLARKIGNGDCEYESVNAYIRGLVRYSFLAPQKHHVTAEMEAWGDRDQDLIDDLCEELAKHPDVHICGQFLEKVVERVSSDGAGDNEEIKRKTPYEILKIAMHLRATGSLPEYLQSPGASE